MDLTSFSLDSVVELVDSNGNVIARSDNKEQEDPSLGGDTIYLGGSALPFQEGDTAAPNDNYSDNTDDPALRVVLPGPAGEVQTYYVRVYSALNIGHIDAADVPNVAALNGTTFQVADSNSLSIGDIDASHVSNLPGLNGTTFQITDGNGKTAVFEFVDSNSSTVLTPGDIAIPYNSTSDRSPTSATTWSWPSTRPTSRTGLHGLAQVDGTIALSGLNVVLDLGKPPSWPSAARSRAQLRVHRTDASPADRPTAGDQAIYYNSTTDSIDTIRSDMVGHQQRRQLRRHRPGPARRHDRPVRLPDHLHRGERPTPFVQYGRSSGSYQLQVRLQVDMDIPGSEVQYSTIRFATNGVDIQGMPSSSPLT